MNDDIKSALDRIEGHDYTHPDQYFSDVSLLHASGELKVKHAPFGYLKLLDDPLPEKTGYLGIKAGTIYIKSSASVDGKPVLFIAEGMHKMVWTYQEDIGDCRCRMVVPTGWSP